MLVRMAIIILVTTIHENQYKIVLLKKKNDKKSGSLYGWTN